MKVMVVAEATADSEQNRLSLEGLSMRFRRPKDDHPEGIDIRVLNDRCAYCANTVGWRT